MIELTQTTAFKLHRATLLIDRLADEYLQREHGIRYAPMLVLLMVRVLGPTSQQAIAQNLDVSRASVTQRVAQLTRDGLLAVEATDGRTNRVTLTAAGETLFDVAWTGLEQHQNGLERGVDEPALVAQLDRIIANAMEIL
ncbi:MarR family transcriptional regulator [Glaciihabitans arcticus]|uniref:MarR family transcriptional regulator n=1 Tax=Glaciihabitans arcticus TaxID=2668039 RepID=A0A4V2JEY9_9MICO|nr:MarR family transcriptional regulator [Glaciihabitans arcticus]TBN57429.1 MarR family transcriptional regulator [Glaciihabitans arcticus]